MEEESELIQGLKYSASKLRREIETKLKGEEKEKALKVYAKLISYMIDLEK